jgi:transcription initiation factor IIE alpha subunit
MRLIPTSYIEQNTKLPKISRYILTQFNEKGVIVYHNCRQRQTYRRYRMGYDVVELSAQI